MPDFSGRATGMFDARRVLSTRDLNVALAGGWQRCRVRRW